MNIRMAVYMYEQLLHVWRGTVEREYQLTKQALIVIRMVNPQANLEGTDLTDEQHRTEMGLARLSAKTHFYEALGVEPPKEMFDPTRDVDQYDMYPDGSSEM